MAGSFQCFFCEKRIDPNYKNIEEIKQFQGDDGLIETSSKTGCCEKHQESLRLHHMYAKHLALL